MQHWSYPTKHSAQKHLLGIIFQVKFQDNLINPITMVTNYQLNLEWITSGAKKIQRPIKIALQ